MEIILLFAENFLKPLDVNFIQICQIAKTSIVKMSHMYHVLFLV